MRVKDIMTIDVITKSPLDTIRDVAVTIFDNELTGLPIVDDEYKVVGIVTEYDLMNPSVAGRNGKKISLANLYSIDPKKHKDVYKDLEMISHTKIREIMTKNPVVVGPETDLGTLIDLILSKQVNPIPVVDDADKLVGIISRSDLVRLLRESKLTQA